MHFNFISWNMRGSWSALKERALCREIRNHHPLLVAFQDTSREDLDKKFEIIDGRHTTQLPFFISRCEIWNHCGETHPALAILYLVLATWESLQFYGMPTTLRFLIIIKNAFSLPFHCKIKGMVEEWVATYVYGPVDTQDKIQFWEETTLVGTHWELPWLLIGEFNVVSS